MPSPDADDRQQSATCTLCGRSEMGPPLGWMYEKDPRRGVNWYCEGCARAHVRAVEAKLNPEWW